MDDKALQQQVIDEVERKIEALNFIDSFKKEMGDIREWRPMADCPYFNKIPLYHITNCYLARLKEKPAHCCIINTSAICKNQLNKKGKL